MNGGVYFFFAWAVVFGASYAALVAWFKISHTRPGPGAAVVGGGLIVGFALSLIAVGAFALVGWFA